MTTSLTNTLRYVLLLVAGFVFGLIALGSMLGTDAKHVIGRVLGMTHKSTVADASCAVPAQQSKEVYFVSCGGFF